MHWPNCMILFLNASVGLTATWRFKFVPCWSWIRSPCCPDSGDLCWICIYQLYNCLTLEENKASIRVYADSNLYCASGDQDWSNRRKSGSIIFFLSVSSVCFSFVILIVTVSKLHVRTLQPGESITFVSLLRNWKGPKVGNLFRQAKFGYSYLLSLFVICHSLAWHHQELTIIEFGNGILFTWLNFFFTILISNSYISANWLLKERLARKGRYNDSEVELSFNSWMITLYDYQNLLVVFSLVTRVILASPHISWPHARMLVYHVHAPLPSCFLLGSINFSNDFRQTLQFAGLTIQFSAITWTSTNFSGGDKGGLLTVFLGLCFIFCLFVFTNAQLSQDRQVRYHLYQ